MNRVCLPVISETFPTFNPPYMELTDFCHNSNTFMTPPHSTIDRMNPGDDSPFRDENWKNNFNPPKIPKIPEEENPWEVHGGKIEGGSNVSSSRNVPSKLSNEEILAMCSQPEDESEQSETGEETPDQNPFTFSMEGSTVNINHSKDIHIGPKTVSSTDGSYAPSNFSSAGTVPPSRQSSTFENTDDSFSMMSSVSSLGSHLREVVNMVGSSPASSSFSVTERQQRRFSESIPESNVPSYQITLDSAQHSSHSHFKPGLCPNSSYEANLKDAQVAECPRHLRKSMSNPVSGNSICPSSCPGSAGGRALQPQYTRQDNVLMSNNPQNAVMSASISNSNNVQMGTQNVYNVYMPVAEHETIQRSVEPLVASSILQSRPAVQPDDSLNFLDEFKEKLRNVYQKRTRSSPLPWHRGKQLIPISEYYTEPQIFSVNRRGNRTTETVNLVSILESEMETRFLVEGEAGMGKTLLATKLAEDWANGIHLQQFKILFLITLGDFKGSLQNYVRKELLPSYFKPEKFDKVWEYCKNNEREILFLLDGYDEFRRFDKDEIHYLIKSKDFSESKVVVTSRPNILGESVRKIVVSGFGPKQVLEFIGKYFKAIGSDLQSESLKKMIENNEKYWKLAKRPLFCMLLCMLYITGGGSAESLPDRQSEVMLQIILCLIKWNRKNSENDTIDFESLPLEYEKPFYNFGKLCLDALKTERSRFTDQEVQGVEGFDSKLKQLGFFLHDNESRALGERKFWKPVHQTFLEYLGAFCMAKHIRECKSCKECKGFNAIFQRNHEVLKFCVGILNHKAYRLLENSIFPVLQKLSVTKLLLLLKEAGAKPENCHAVAKLLDQTTVEISTSETEFEVWSQILSQPFKNFNSLKITWRIKSQSPDQESSFTEASELRYKAFFEALKNNESVTNIYVRAKHDGEAFTEEKIEMFFSHFQLALFKKNLKELEIVDMKMKASSHLRAAFEAASNQPSKVRALHELKSIKLHTFMMDVDLKGICESLKKSCPSLENLHLAGLEHGQAGFKSLVRLLRANHKITSLHLSMNQSLFVNIFGSSEIAGSDYSPAAFKSDIKRMCRTAARRSKQAYSKENTPQESDVSGGSGEVCENSNYSPELSTNSTPREVDPTKELQFLFDNIPLDKSQWSLKAMGHWYLNIVGNDSRIPLPLCISGEHKSVFHYLFSSLPETHIKNLNLIQAGLYLTTPDLICLGDAVRKSTHLSSLNLQGLDKVESYLPLIIGLGQSPALVSVDLSSSKIVVKDDIFCVMCSALQRNTVLRHLSLERWQFQLQNHERAMEHFSNIFSSWHVSRLNLKQCVIDLTDQSLGEHNPQFPTTPCSSPLKEFFRSSSNITPQVWGLLKNISLEAVEFKDKNFIVRRGHLLLLGLTNFSNLVSLDLSMSLARNFEVDNIAIRSFFRRIGSEMKHLSELKLDNWKLCINAKENTSDFAASLRSCKKLKKVELGQVKEIIDEFSLNVASNDGSSWCHNTFLHMLISNLPNLEELSLCFYSINNCRIDQDMATRLGTCFHDHWKHNPFWVKFFDLGPEAEDALYSALKKHPFRVKRSTNKSLMQKFYVHVGLSPLKMPFSYNKH